MLSRLDIPIKPIGDIDEDRFNVLLSYRHDEQSNLRATDRSFARSSRIPVSYNGKQYVYDKTATGTAPANATVSVKDKSDYLFNPYLAKNNNCGAVTNAPLAANQQACGFDGGSTVEIVPESKRDSLFTRASYKLNDSLNAFAEARRVLKPGGTLVAMIWGEREDCEAATFLKALGGLMPSTMPPGAGPFALTSDRKLENLIGQAGFTIHHQVDRENAWIYPDQDTALRGLLSAGPAAAAIAHSGEERVRTELRQSMQPFVKPDGRVIYRNKFRIVIAKK